MGYVGLNISLFSAGSALEAQAAVERALREGLSPDYLLHDGDVLVEIAEHSGACSRRDCGGTDHEPEPAAAIVK